MATLMETEKNRLIRKFHTLLAKGGISNEEKQAMLASYGVTSSREMNTYELLELCGKIDRMVNPRTTEAEKWRRRVIAVVCDYLSECGYRYSEPVEAAKKMACRISGQASFNRIPVDRLRSIYHAFRKRTDDLKAVDRMTREILTGKGSYPSADAHFD